MSLRNNLCFCMGPQNGEPYCPCKMRSMGIIKKNGRWIQPERTIHEIDIGPVLDRTFPDHFSISDNNNGWDDEDCEVTN